jgi:hypothetical protein
MLTRVALTGLAVLALVTTAGATNSPRFKLKPGWTKARALANTATLTNRTPGFSGSQCWVSDGNARLGWRHNSCIGIYENGGTGRFKVVYTPISCTKERVVITVPGLVTQRKIGSLSRRSAFRIAC